MRGAPLGGRLSRPGHPPAGPCCAPGCRGVLVELAHRAHWSAGASMSRCRSWRAGCRCWAVCEHGRLPDCSKGPGKVPVCVLTLPASGVLVVCWRCWRRSRVCRACARPLAGSAMPGQVWPGLAGGRGPRTREGCGWSGRPTGGAGGRGGTRAPAARGDHDGCPPPVQAELGNHGPGHGPVSAAGSGFFSAVAVGRELAMAAPG